MATTIARVLAAAGDKQALPMGEDILRMTLDRHPRSLSSLMLLAMMMQDAGRNEESAKLNRKILEIDPKSVIALNNLAWILCGRRESRPDRVQGGPGNWPRRASRSFPITWTFSTREGMPTTAWAILTKRWRISPSVSSCIRPNSPSSATPRFHLAMTYAAMKRKAEAMEQLRTALDSNRANVRSAKEQADAGRVTYAIKVLKDALQLQDQMEPLRTALGCRGRTARRPRRSAEAKALLEQMQKGN